MTITSPSDNKITNSQIDKLGKQLKLITNTSNQGNHNDEVLKMLSAWRALHIYPLNQVFKLIKKKADKIGNNAIYGQRLKRANSIIAKIQGHDTRLSSMQDIGGCRVIFTEYKKVTALFLELGKSNSIKLLKNYIYSPKNDGYRSIHLAYTLNSKTPKYNGLHIEIQLRTALQHTWATTVEIVDFAGKQKMKQGQGDEYWKRFFYLVAEEFALLENLPLHNSTVSSEERRRELNNIITANDIFNTIKAYTDIVNKADKLESDKSKKYILIILNIKESKVNWKSHQSFEEAEKSYSLTEKQYIANDDVNILLVQTPSLKELKKAYPNYFYDTKIFLEKIKRILKLK